ncbi:hypothetical protein Cgig2_015356 [Carnegiea gigantea]|uniref:Uncharacterized protein n=1 Tax=Carnegiea gigantea TaxID=171969 RepID=A0A9Q1K7Z3_9CARY|nr:hypothetical protein Cgig2_015356 [Carnegiea gigantea]
MEITGSSGAESSSRSFASEIDVWRTARILIMIYLTAAPLKEVDSTLDVTFHLSRESNKVCLQRSLRLPHSAYNYITHGRTIGYYDSRSMTYMDVQARQSISNILKKQPLSRIDQIVESVMQVKDSHGTVIVANSIDQEINSTSQVDAQQVPFNFSHKANAIMHEGN